MIPKSLIADELSKNQSPFIDDEEEEATSQVSSPRQTESESRPVESYGWLFQ